MPDADWVDLERWPPAGPALELENLHGRTIERIVQNSGAPSYGGACTQLALVFTDGSYVNLRACSCCQGMQVEPLEDGFGVDELVDVLPRPAVADPGC